VIEQVMVFALGFLIAGLVALAFAPVFWARAIRLSVRRLEMQLPLSMREILADRDQVRAESAVEQRRVELKAEALNQAHVADLAELGRRAARITQMQEHIAGLRQTNTAQSLDLAKLSRAHAELSTEASALSKELYDLDGLRARGKDKFNELTYQHNSLLTVADEQKATLATLSAWGAAIEARLADTERTLNTTQTMLCNKEAEATLLASHLERARDEVHASDLARQSAIDKYERQGNRVADLEGRLKDAQEAQAESLARLRTLAGKLEAHENELRQAAQVEEDLRLKHDSLVERMRTVERGLIDRIDRLRTENAALQGALGAARQECSSLSRDLSLLRQTHPGQPGESPSASNPADDAASMKAHSV
jgi:chromosome segregation ATPase